MLVSVHPNVVNAHGAQLLKNSASIIRDASDPIPLPGETRELHTGTIEVVLPFTPGARKVNLINMFCENCQNGLQVEAKHKGKKVECPRCRHENDI